MKNNRRNSLLSLCLIILMTVNSAGTVFAQPVQNDQPEVSADNMQIEADGTDSAGEMIASVITEKQEQTGAQQQSDSYVTDLGLQGTTATVEYGTNKKADIVVAIYEEGKTQMIASGKTSIEAGSGTATVNISTGTMPQYFVASAFLLDADTHKALCQEYTTELYTKGIQDIKNSTPDDFEDKEVLRLNGEADDDNFAVYNDRTLTAEATDPNNKIQDNGNGTYTIKNADADFRSLKKGDTFSYEYADGTVLLVKVADVSISGTTVTVKEDSNTDLTDYFDYLKIEADDSNANYTVDNSKLEDGITPLTSEQSLDDTEAVGATNGGGTFRHNVSYYIEKNFEDSGSENFCKVKADVHFFFSFNVNFYLSTSYKYVSVKLDYELGISGSFAFGTESARDFAIGEISAFVIPCVKVAFTPSVVLSAKTEILWTGKITGTIGCCWDENFGFKNLCTSPKTQNDLKQRGNFFIGIKIKPAVQLIDSRVAEVSVNGSAGLEIRTEKLLDTSDTGKSSLHECGYGSCYAGTVYIKLAAEASAKLVKGWLGGSVTLAQLDIKFGDFYYSETYDEFNFTTCPHISYKVSLSVADTKMNKVKDATVYVLDKKTGSLVQMRLPGEEGKKVTKVDGVKTDDSGQCTFYLPTGDYLLKVKNGDLSCDKAFSVGVTKTELRIEDFPVKQTEPGKDGNITWKIDVDGTLYLNGSGAMQDFTEEDDDNAILPPWNDKDKEIYSVEIGDGITSIGNHAFDGCVNLSEVNMPDTVTLIGDSAFKECWNLEELTLSENLKKIRANAFTQCNMDILEIPASVTEIEDMAFAYTGLRWMYFKGNRPSFTEKAFCYTTISAYYPTGNTSWSGIQNMKSSTYNYDVTWNPYDPSIDIEEPESDEIEVAGSGIAEEEEAGEVIFEDGKNEEQNEEENPEISVDSDSKDTQKEEQEETSVTEESQDTEDISDGIVTVEDKPVFNELIQPSEDVKMSQASMATGMQPGTLFSTTVRTVGLKDLHFSLMRKIF